MTEEEREKLEEAYNELTGNSWPRWHEMKIEDKIDSLVHAIRIIIEEKLNEKK